MEGIIDAVKKNKYVILSTVGGNKPKETIKENAIVGRVSTIIPIEEEEQMEEFKDWTKSRMISEVNLGDDLNEEQKSEVYKILIDVKEALSRSDTDIGIAKVIPHRIELTDNTPIWQKPSHFSDFRPCCK